MGMIALSREVELVYSSDDDANYGKGYYLQRWPDQSTSPSYKTQQAAIKAFRKGVDTIKWDR